MLIQKQQAVLTGYSVVARCQSSECVNIPQEDGPVQASWRYLFSVSGISQRFHIILVSAQCGHTETFMRIPHLHCCVWACRYYWNTPTSWLKNMTCNLRGSQFESQSGHKLAWDCHCFPQLLPVNDGKEPSNSLQMLPFTTRCIPISSHSKLHNLSYQQYCQINCT